MIINMMDKVKFQVSFYQRKEKCFFCFVSSSFVILFLCHSFLCYLYLCFLHSLQFLTPNQEELQRGLSPLPPGSISLESYQASLEEVQHDVVILII